MTLRPCFVPARVATATVIKWRAWNGDESEGNRISGEINRGVDSREQKRRKRNERFAEGGAMDARRIFPSELRNEGVWRTEVPQRGLGTEPRWGLGRSEAPEVDIFSKYCIHTSSTEPLDNTCSTKSTLQQEECPLHLPMPAGAPMGGTSRWLGGRARETTCCYKFLYASCVLSRAGLSIVPVPVVPWEPPPPPLGGPNQLPNFYHAVLTFERAVYAV